MKTVTFKRFAAGLAAGLVLLTALAWQLDPNTRYFMRVSVSQTNSVNEEVVTNGLTIGGVRNTAWPPTTNFPPSTDLNFGGKAATNISDITVTGSITINGIQYTTTTNFPPSTDLDFNNKSATNVAAVVLPGGDVQSQLNGKQSALTFDNGVTNDNGVVNGAFDAGSNVTLTTNSHRIVISAAGGGAGGIPDPGANGLVVRTALNTSAATTILGSSSDIDVANGNGVSSNPTISSSDLVTAGTSAKVTFNAKGKITGTNTLTTAEIQSALGQVYMSTNSTLTAASTNTFVGTGRIPLENEIPSLQTNVAAANPTATVATTAVNGTASTFMRSDAAPAIPAAFIQANQTNVAAANPTATVATTAVNGTAATFMRSDASPAIPAAFIQANQTNVAAANPTATVATTAVNGTAATFMRSDASPAIPAAFIQSNQTNVAGANPTATASGTVNNGTAATFMRSDASPAIATTTITDSAGIGAGSTLTIGTGYTVSSSTATPTFGSVTAAFKAKGPIFDITAYGGDGSGTTTTVSSWNDTTHVVVADASSFAIGQGISIDRAGGNAETTGNTSAGSGTISSVAATNGFAINDYIRVIGGQAAQAQVRTIQIKVAGNAGDVVSAEINGVTYRYTVAGGNTVNDIATGLAAAITGDATITASASTDTVSITAVTAGTPFTYQNIRPFAADPTENVRTKVIYQTSVPNIPQTDVVVKITGATATTFTVTPVIPSAVTGARIEKYSNRLVTSITGKSGSTLTLNNAAGVMPTGVTVYHDSGAALDSAISAAGSGTVFVPAGTFYLGNLLTGHTFGNASLVGLGKGVSVLKAPGWAIGGKCSWKTTANGASNIVVRGLTLDEGCNAYVGQSGWGFRVGTYTATGYNTNVIFSEVEMLNSAAYGILLYNIRGGIVEKCHIQNTGNNALFFGLYDNLSSATFQESYDIWVTGNLIEQCAWIGGSVYGDASNAGTYTVGKFRNVHVNNNTFRHCALLGWEFYTGAYDSEMTGNTVEYCGGWESMWGNGSVHDHGGLTVKYCQNIVVANNTVRNCWRALEVFGRTNDTTAGFVITRSIRLTGNIATDCYQGISCSSGTDSLDILGNTISTMQDSGIIVSSLDSINYPIMNPRILDNTVRNCQRGIDIGPNVYRPQISGNLLDSNNGYEETANTASGVTLNAFGDGTHVATNAIVSGNRFVETRVSPAHPQIYAVYADQCKDITLAGNYAAGNANNTYSITANGTLTKSMLNTWDSEGFMGSTPSGTGAFAKQVSPALTAPTITGRTWATIIGTTPTAGTIDFATDLGPGTHVSYVGSRWKPVNGRATLAMLGAQQTGIANVETIVLQTLIPANTIQVNDVIRITAELTKSGTTDTCSVCVRVGTAGTTSDTAVVNGAGYIAAANKGWAGFNDFKLLSATSLGKVGGSPAISTGVGPVSAGSAESAPVTITSAAANALYVSFTIKSSSTSDTVGISNGAIELLTP